MSAIEKSSVSIAKSAIAKYRGDVASSAIAVIHLPVSQKIDGKVVTFDKVLNLESVKAKILHKGERVVINTQRGTRVYTGYLGKTHSIYKGDRLVSSRKRTNTKKVSSLKSIIIRDLNKKAKKVLVSEVIQSDLISLIKEKNTSMENLRPFLDWNYELSQDDFGIISKACGLKNKHWSEILNIIPSRLEKTIRFNHKTSMHILNVLILFNFGTEVMEGRTNFKNWLKKKNVFLDGAPPYFYLDSPSGIEILMRMINRIQHGINA